MTVFGDTRPSPLLDRIASPEVLMAAWKKVRSNKGAPGIDRVTLQEFEKDLQANLEVLSRSLREGTYYPMPVRRVLIKKASGKERPLGILVIEDRLAQRAALDLLEPLFEREFLDCSFGYRPGRSIEQAIGRVLELRAQGNAWVVDADIQDFFGNLDHRLLMDRLAQKIKDEGMLRLIRLWLDVGALGNVPDDSAPSLLQRSADYLEVVVERAIDGLLQEEGLAPWGMGMDGEGADPLDPEEAQARARREALKRLGRDGILLLLTCARRGGRLLSPPGMAIAGGALLASSALPAAGKALQERMRERRWRRGVVQGGALSPLLSNVYLHPFDRAMTQRGYPLVRYCDDFLVLCPDKVRARQALEAAREGLAEIRLSLHPAKTRIAHFEEELHFLGHLFTAEGASPPPPGHPPWTERLRPFLEEGIAGIRGEGRRLKREGRELLEGLSHWKRRK